MVRLRVFGIVIVPFLIAACGKIDGSLLTSVGLSKGFSDALPGDAVVIGDHVKIPVTGGRGPFHYEIVSGPGYVNPDTGEFTATGLGDTVVRVTDNTGDNILYTIHTVSPLSAYSSPGTVATTNRSLIMATGGVGTLNYQIFSGAGTVDATGVFSSATTGTSIIQVTDSRGHVATTSVNVNPSLGISPLTQTMWTLTTQSFTGTDGVPPYSYTLLSGDGSIGGTNGLYQASATATTAIVMVTDAVGNTATANVTVNQGVNISPTSITLAAGNSTTFSANGGPAPYVYSVTSGGTHGSVNSSTGLLTTTSAGSITVRVTDNAGNTADATVTVNAALQITPSTKTLAVNNNFTFGQTGGVGPYAYSVTSGGGSVNSSTGAFTAGSSPGTSTVRVTDSLSNTSDAIVTVNAALGLSPLTATITTANTINFAATDGVTPYTFAVASGVGSVNSSTGVYNPGATPGTAVVTVSDAEGNSVSANVTVNAAIGITVDHATIASNNTATATGSGGVAPLTYSKVSGPGSIDSSTGVYTPGASGTAELKVTDSMGNNTSLFVTINAALAISPASKMVLINNTQSFTAMGGVTPYIYTLQSGIGSFSSPTYTAPATTGSAVVRVTDALGNTSDSTLTIEDWTIITLTADVANYNLYTAAGSPAGIVKYKLIINPGVTVYSSSYSTVALTTGTGWAVGSQIQIENNGNIFGGRAVGKGDVSYNQAPPGGPALQIDYAATIINAGQIVGGAGNGGQGEGDSCYPCGGGNGGSNGGQGGAGIILNANAAITNTNIIYGAGGGGSGGGGAYAAGYGSGAGGNGDGAYLTALYSAEAGAWGVSYGGDGGTYGQAGLNGGNAGNGQGYGGAGGYAIVINGKTVTYNGSPLVDNSSYTEATWIAGTKGRIAP